MQLASQVAGALVAGGLVLLLVRQVGLRDKRAFGAIVIVPVAAACILALPALHQAGSRLLDQRDVNADLSAEQARLAAGTSLGVNVAFLGWAGNHFAAGDTFHLAVGDSVDAETVTQWSLFQLAPHLAKERPADADWLVFYDTSAEGRGGLCQDAETYAPGFAVVRNVDAC